MNENRSIDNPLNKYCKVRWHTQDENMHWITTEQTMGLIFNIQNSQLLNWFSPTQEIFQVHEKSRTLANLTAVGFRLRQNRRQVALFLYAQPLCIETWVRDKSFQKLF